MLLRTLLVLLISTTGALAQLTWGTGGAGGTGTWDTTTQDWYNGTSNVVWDGNIAIFAGTSSGTVTVNGTVPANELIFNTAGYILTPANTGTIMGPTNGTLSMIANANATVNAAITNSDTGTGQVFLKDGAGTLSVGGNVTWYSQVQINNGTLDFTSGQVLTTTLFTLKAITPGARNSPSAGLFS